MTLDEVYRQGWDNDDDYVRACARAKAESRIGQKVYLSGNVRDAIGDQLDAFLLAIPAGTMGTIIGFNEIPAEPGMAHLCSTQIEWLIEWGAPVEKVMSFFGGDPPYPLSVWGIDEDRWAECGTIASRIEYIRNLRGFSTEVFADMVGISTNRLSTLLDTNAWRRPPAPSDLPELEQIAAALRVSMDCLQGKCLPDV